MVLEFQTPFGTTIVTLALHGVALKESIGDNYSIALHRAALENYWGKQYSTLALLEVMLEHLLQWGLWGNNTTFAQERSRNNTGHNRIDKSIHDGHIASIE